MEIRTFLIGSYILGLALSLDTTWINTLKFCSLANQRMSTEDDVVTRNNTWLGKAKYELTWGVITLQVQRVEENETCSEQVCSASKKHCQFCPVKLNESMSSFEELRTMLTPGRKYIIEDSWSRNVKKIPVQTKCLVYRGASNTEYVSCNKSFFDGCSSSDDKPPFKFIIYLEDNSEEGTATYTYFVSSIETGRVPNDTCHFFHPNLEHTFLLVGLFCIFIIINALCIWCCINFQVKRKLQSLSIQQINDNSCKPISEAITRMYKSINAFKEEQNDTYDFSASVRKKSNFAITSGMNDKDNYDTGFFRLLTQSGDYDMAWSNSCTSPTSPDVEYDHVQNVGAIRMTCLPEEDINSKQRSLIHEISSDFNQICNDEIENPKELVSEKTTASINGLFDVEENISRFHNLDKCQASVKKDIVGYAEPDKGRQQKQNIVYEENSKMNQKEPCLTDEAVIENRKKTADNDVRKSLGIGEKEQGTQSGKENLKKSKVHIESKSDNKSYSSQRAEKVVDKATSLLVAKMNRVLSETKL